MTFTLTINIDSDPINHVNDVLGTLHDVSMQLEELRGQSLPPAGTVTDIQDRQWASWTTADQTSIATGTANVLYVVEYSNVGANDWFLALDADTEESARERLAELERKRAPIANLEYRVMRVTTTREVRREVT